MTHDTDGNDRQNGIASGDEGRSVRTFASAQEVAQAGAERFVEVAAAAVEKNGRYSVVLAGGTTYLKMYALLAERTGIDWSRVHLFIGDERFVPHDDPQSNWGTITKAFLDHIDIPKGNLHPMRTEGLGLEESAKQYEQELVTFFGSDETAFDLVLLGIGPDGHTLSIFPGSEEAKNPSDRLAIAVHDSPKPPPERISLTYTAVNHAKNVLFLVTGAEKKEALEGILYGPEDRMKWPPQGIQPENGKLTWLLEAAIFTPKTHGMPYDFLPLTAKQEAWVNHLNDTDRIEIRPYDQLSEAKFQTLKGMIQAVIGTSVPIVHRGASSMGISGQGELDVYLPVTAAMFESLIAPLKSLFGEPRSLYPLERARFVTQVEGMKAEVFLVNDQGEGWMESVKFEDYLRSHPAALDAYRRMKEEGDGLSTREYYRRKKGFINAILVKATEGPQKVSS